MLSLVLLVVIVVVVVVVLLVAAKGFTKVVLGAIMLFFKFLRFSRVGRCGSVQQESVSALTTGVKTAGAVGMVVGDVTVGTSAVSVVEVTRVEIVAVFVVKSAADFIVAVPVNVVPAVNFAACKVACLFSLIALVLSS
jgi:hypothetical protein